MSRFGGWEDAESDYNNAGDLWQANVRRALGGRRGRKALTELREALLALPEKRLIAGALCLVGGADRPDERIDDKWARQEVEYKVEQQGEGVCAIGAFLWHRKVKAGADPQAAFDELPTLLDVYDGGMETADAGKAAGLTFTLAWDLAYRNDELLEAATPEERYEKFLAWIDGELAEEVTAHAA